MSLSDPARPAGGTTAAGGTVLRLAGRDALALLHRIGTNALDDLGPGLARATLFCDFRGRLLHRAVAGRTADGAVWLVRDDAPGAELAAFLDRHVFRDDVRIEDRSGDLAVATEPQGDEPPPGTLAEQDGVPRRLRAEGDWPLRVGGAPGMADAAHERARVRAGRPAHGHEIAEAFTPFEAGLAAEVHLDKGCFTGQEALMRLVTYRSVRRRLVRVRGTGAAPAVPVPLTADGTPVGILTTAVADEDAWMGLAIVRHEVCDPPRALASPAGAVAIELLPLARPRGRP